MKFIWEESDIRGGRKYGRDDLSEHWMIGYRPSPVASVGNEYFSVSMNDGMITVPMDKAAMARELTLLEFVPLVYLQAGK